MPPNPYQPPETQGKSDQGRQAPTPVEIAIVVFALAVFALAAFLIATACFGIRFAPGG